MAYTRDDEINDNSGRTWPAPQAPSGVTAIISDEDVIRVHGHANFGTMSPRQVVNDGVSKAAVGYHCGHTQFTILREHGLITKPRGMSYDVNLTKKGKRYYRALLAVSALQPERLGEALTGHDRHLVEVDFPNGMRLTVVREDEYDAVTIWSEDGESIFTQAAVQRQASA